MASIPKSRPYLVILLIVYVHKAFLDPLMHSYCRILDTIMAVRVLPKKQ